MNSWLDKYNPREQLSLLLLALAVVIYIAYMVLWAPLQERREQLQLANVAEAEKLQRVEGMVSEFLQLQKSGQAPAGRRNLTTLVNQSTARYQLPVSRLQPNSRGEIQVRLENVAFDSLLAWLYDMEHGESLQIAEASITESGARGRVNATIRVAPGA